MSAKPRQGAGRRPAARVAVAITLLAWAAACASSPEVDPRYEPTENVLEVVAVLRQHVPDDTYRFEPARDFTGRNVYRSSLLRLESLETLHSESLVAGHMDGVIAFAKGRAFERMRAYDLAADEYRVAAARDEMLKLEALRSADVCDELHAARQGGQETREPDSGDPSVLAWRDIDELPPIAGPAEDADEEVAEELLDTDIEAVLGRFDERIGRLEQLGGSVESTHYAPIVLEEIEFAEVERARYFRHMRKLIPGGNVRAVAEYRTLVVNHEDSKHASRHILALADLYSDLAVEYVDGHPPESMDFDPVRFQELVDSASQLYGAVANQDGKPEKLEASRRMEAFLAFALQVDNDRFTP